MQFCRVCFAYKMANCY